MNAFASDPSFVAAHLAPLPFKFQSREGRDVHVRAPDGVSVSGYYVAAKRGNHSAIVMVHEWWGLNDYIKQQAVTLHDRTGYAVFAIDLYGGRVAKTASEAGALMAAIDPVSATATVSSAVKALKGGLLGTTPQTIGTIGWCFGGGWSLQAAIQGGEAVQACVMYYGMPDDDQTHLARLKSPVLLIEGLKDAWISPKVVGDFKAAMAQAGKNLEVKTYDEDHAFANPSNPKYSAADATDAMNRSVKFFAVHLR